MTELKVQKIGDEVAVVLDEETLTLLGAEVGDTLRVEKAEKGVLVSTEPESDVIRRGRAFIERYRKTFEALAK